MRKGNLKGVAEVSSSYPFMEGDTPRYGDALGADGHFYSSVSMVFRAYFDAVPAGTILAGESAILNL